MLQAAIRACPCTQVDALLHHCTRVDGLQHQITQEAGRQRQQVWAVRHQRMEVLSIRQEGHLPRLPRGQGRRTLQVGEHPLTLELEMLSILRRAHRITQVCWLVVAHPWLLILACA